MTGFSRLAIPVFLEIEMLLLAVNGNKTLHYKVNSNQIQMRLNRICRYLDGQIFRRQGKAQIHSRLPALQIPVPDNPVQWIYEEV